MILLSLAGFPYIERVNQTKMKMCRFCWVSLLLLMLVACRERSQTPYPGGEGGVLEGLPDIVAVAETAIPTVLPPPTLAPDAVVVGQQVYIQHCARCHGDDLEGQANWKEQNEDGSFRAPPHDANGHTWHHNDRLLIEAIEQGGARLPTNIGGTSNMPAFANVLTDEEITAVLSYIKSTWLDDIRVIQWEQTVREQP